jgi:hypothetical protein
MNKLTSKNIKPVKKADKLLKYLIDTYLYSMTYCKADDGLPKKEVENYD